MRTGDLGRVDEEGFLYLDGREKDIIKCAGERISPQEIESVLASHPQVEEVAVIGVPDSMLGEAVKAFIGEVQGKKFPAEEHTFSMKDETLAELRKVLKM